VAATSVATRWLLQWLQGCLHWFSVKVADITVTVITARGSTAVPTVVAAVVAAVADTAASADAACVSTVVLTVMAAAVAARLSAMVNVLVADTLAVAVT
jgi:hypothetical protein